MSNNAAAAPQCALGLDGEGNLPEEAALDIATTSGTILRLRAVAMSVTPSKDVGLWNRFQGPHLADGHLDAAAQAAVVAFMRSQKTEALTDGVRDLTMAGGSLAICYPDRMQGRAAAKPAVPTLVLEAQRLWRMYLQAERQKDDSNAELASAERMARGDVDDFSLVFRGSASADHDRVKIAKEAREMVRRHAERVFAPEGGRLTIPDEALRGDEALTSASYDHLDLVKVWESLEERYGGDKGKDEGHRQNARKLVHEFDLREHAPKKVGGLVVLNLSVSTQASFGHSSSGRELSYYCRDSVQKACSAFAAFLRAIGEPFAASELDRFTRRLFSENYAVVSRQVFKFGFGQITTYYERFEFRVLPHIAEQLQVYLGTHAGSSEND